MTQDQNVSGCPVTGKESKYEILQVSQVISSYDDISSALRSSSLVTRLHDGSQQFRGGTLRSTDGPVHKRRRKAMGVLFRGDGDRWFRDNVLTPTIEQNLVSVLNNVSADGYARTDMVGFVRRAFFQLAAGVIGLQHVNDLEYAENLRQFCEPINIAMSSSFREGDRDAMMDAGLEAKEQFRTSYFEPALAAHEELVAAVERGAADETSLPHDLLTIIARGDDPALSDDHGLALRESITDLINAGTFSSSFTLLHILAESLKWFDEHPESAHLREDDEFVGRLVREGLRLHPVVPMLYRQATADITLPSGKEIHEGEFVGIDVRPGNRDVEKFGPDAEEFNPRRTVGSDAYDYGLTFGTGRHMCFGLPLILGSTGADGSHAQLLKAFLAAGIEYDPDDPPVKTAGTGPLSLWDRFPVRFATPALLK